MRHIIFLTFPILLAACATVSPVDEAVVCDTANCSSPNTKVIVE